MYLRLSISHHADELDDKFLNNLGVKKIPTAGTGKRERERAMRRSKADASRIRAADDKRARDVTGHVAQGPRMAGSREMGLPVHTYAAVSR